MNLVFKALLAAIVTFMVVAFSLIGVSVLINNFGTIGFVIAPFFALGVAFTIFIWWRKFLRKHFPSF